MLAARRGYDPIGVLIIALVSAGGGLIRDGMLLQSGPPALLRSPVYLGLIAAAAFAVLMFGGYLKNRRGLFTIVAGVDAVGLIPQPKSRPSRVAGGSSAWILRDMAPQPGLDQHARSARGTGARNLSRAGARR